MQDGEISSGVLISLSLSLRVCVYLCLCLCVCVCVCVCLCVYVCVLSVVVLCCVMWCGVVWCGVSVYEHALRVGKCINADDHKSRLHQLRVSSGNYPSV